MIKNIAELNERGFTIFHQFFEDNYLNELSSAIDQSYKICRKVQVANGIQEVTDGTVHHLLATDNSIYIDLLKKISISKLNEFIKSFFTSNYILNSFGGVINLKDKTSYVANIHRDIRLFSGEFPLMLNMLIMLDDFSIENGATYLLEGSHKIHSKPNEEVFYNQSVRALGNRGAILFFNSNLWHAAGLNTTSNKRRALTLTFTKPFMKQQLDYSRALGYEKVACMSDEIKQIIGFFSRTPSNLEEWYQKPEERFYRRNQD
jgi:ectoine hydroxylase-related dioxygenase (phytanoyl-CoA dioxygenase family)